MVAPLIAAAIPLAAEFLPGMIRYLAGDKAGDVAKTVVETAQAITGTTTPDSAAAAMRADPALAAKFRVDMANFEVELEKAYLADRQSARNRDVAYVNAGRHNYRADVMLIMAFLTLIVVLVLLYVGRATLTGEIIATLTLAAGALLKMIGDAFAFEYGSSRSSQSKDQTIANLTK